MAVRAKNLITPEEYLDFERGSDAKHEYVHGEIVAMSGGTLSHDRICRNTMNLLDSALQPPCEAFTASMRIQTTATHYCYADTSVACGPILVEDSEQDTILNPVLVIEVLSKSTAAYDRGLKFHRYKSIHSLQEYVLISQTRPFIERFLRSENNDWIQTTVEGLDAGLRLESVGCIVSLARIYARVEFAE